MLSFLKKNKLNLLLCLGELAVGVLLLINPDAFNRAIIMAVGVLVAVLGILDVIRYFRTNPLQASMERRLAYGLGQLAIGACCLFKTDAVLRLFSAVARLYGAGVLVLALFRIQQFVDVRRLKLGTGIVSGLSAIITLAYAAIIMALPNTNWIFLFIGVMLLFEAVMDILILFFERKAS